jgi:hypothetical protein
LVIAHNGLFAYRHFRTNTTTMAPKRTVSFPLSNTDSDGNDETTELEHEISQVNLIYGNARDGYNMSHCLKRYVLDNDDVVSLFGSNNNNTGLVVMLNREAKMVRDSLGDIATEGTITICYYKKVPAPKATSQKRTVRRAIVSKQPSTSGKRKRA